MKIKHLISLIKIWTKNEPHGNKYIFLFFLTLLFTNCNNSNKQKNNFQSYVLTKEVLDSIVESSKKNSVIYCPVDTNLIPLHNNVTKICKDSFNTFKYGQLIIDNKIQPSDNEETFACLDSLHTHNKFKTRQFFFKVYRTIAQKSDGALSEVIGGHLKEYLFNFPNECLENFRHLNNGEQTTFIDYLAYEFYASASSKNYIKEINIYFGNIQPSSFYIDSEEDNKLLEYFKNSITKGAKKKF